MRYCAHGNHRRTVSPHRAVVADATRQRDANLHILNAILYVAEQGCKWRGLPKRFGNWHTIYTRMNRWSKSGVLDRVVAQLQHARIICVKIEAVALDSTIVKAIRMARGR